MGAPSWWKIDAKTVGIYLSLKFYWDHHLNVSYSPKELCKYVSQERLTEESSI